LCISDLKGCTNGEQVQNCQILQSRLRPISEINAITLIDLRRAGMLPMSNGDLAPLRCVTVLNRV